MPITDTDLFVARAGIILPPKPIDVEDWSTITTSYTVEPKVDGWSLLIANPTGDATRAFTRSKEVTDAVRQCPWWRELEKGDVVMGELYAPGELAAAVSTYLARDPKHLEFAVWHGKEQARVLSPNVWVIYGEQVEYVWNDEYAQQQLSNYLALKNCAAPVEGWIFRSPDGKDVRRWKPCPTRDFTVTGVTPGKGKYKGLVGSLELSDENGNVVCDCSGMTDEMRAGITELHETGILLGKVVEVKYQYVAKNGRLRHPRFVRFREDKQYDV